MNKRKIIVFLAFLLSFLLVSCSNDKKSLSESIEKTASSKNAIEEIADADTGVESVDKIENDEQTVQIIPDAYIPVLNGIYNFITDSDEDNPYGLIGILEAMDPIGNPEKDLSSIGYAVKNINDDGLEELFISDNNNIFGLYTIEGDEAILVTEGWARSRNYLLSDNTIYYEGSGGAVQTIFGAYKLNSGSTELEVIDMYFSDFVDDEQQEIGWFYEGDDSDNANDSVLTEMTSDDALK